MFAIGYIPNSGIEQFQDFWKHFSILFKSQQLQLIRKTETNKERERERGKPTRALPVLAQPTWLGPADWPCQSSSSSRQKDAERVASARGHTPATSCFCRRPGDVQGCHATPMSPSHPRSLSSRLPHPLPHHGRRTCRRLTAVVALSVTPSPL